MVDHRASPGLTPEQAIKLGYHPGQVAEGKVFEAATLTCAHCSTVVVKNPLRARERASCMKCGLQYICDRCELASRQPDYVHLSMEMRKDLAFKGAF